ncbi:MAG: chemotaxis protein CheC [Parcubacteria group bacterium Gr01-1014_18]|nr:MAG: chemotaxis protein CheC [Parcubacteria group bacterium Greene0416_36]TSC80997.1 MAG: chemotaxis protein CheC [Parcubacteria group bacterium Gr01-1014_18]TSC98884.1 MAG: chemotaxis protein CheC [Parcubacteria group bacterium Greene1014_20]TSD06530.1 MAG: chemotaxis protein CheC [Parcubacteria group bacterium Greene0714_2]
MSLTLGDFERDQIKEVINIGGGNASTSLSRLIGKPVFLGVPQLFLDRIEKTVSHFSSPQETSTAVLLNTRPAGGPLMLFLLPHDSADYLVQILGAWDKKKPGLSTDLARSSLAEAGNILGGAFLDSLSSFLELDFVQSVPEVVRDMTGSIIDSIVSPLGMHSEEILVCSADFRVENSPIQGQFYFIFSPESTLRILEKTHSKIS